MRSLRSISTLLVSIAFIWLCTLSCGFKVSADTYGDWEYSLSDSGVTITAYNGSAKNVVIPNSINGYTVIKIADYVFCDNQMTEVTIPEGITSIGKGAFKNCKYLSVINFNAQNCADCSDMNYWNGDAVFYNVGINDISVKVIFGSKVKRIPANLFYTSEEKNKNIYAHISDVVMSSSIIDIGSQAFSNCYDLSKVTWGNSIETIGEYAFASCWLLKSITIPETTTVIGKGAFKECRTLESIIYNARNCEDCSDMNYWNGDAVFYNAGSDGSSLKVIFGASVKEIPANIFYTTEDYNYGDGAYAHITCVNIAASVTRIGNQAFRNCYDLSEVTWGNSIETIGEYTFESCWLLKNIIIPETTTVIGKGAFKECRALESIVYNARNCEDCSDMNYWNGDAVFYNVGTNGSSLKVIFGPSVEEIPANIFYTSEDYNYGDGAYAHITCVNIASSVTRIGNQAFRNCYDLSEVTWGNSIETIGEYAFASCWLLKSITIPETTTAIGKGAFKECRALESIVYNAKNCEDCSNMNFWNGDAVFYNTGTDGSSLKVVFGTNVKEIPANIFYTSEDYNYGDGYYAHITSVEIASSVTYIGEYAFANCYDLQTVTFKGGYVSRGENAFLNLPSSTKIIYSNSAPLQKTSITKIQNTATGIKLTWKKVSGVQYNVYHKVGSGAWRKVTTVSGNSYTDKNVTNGSRYSYKISCYKSGKESSYSASKTFTRLTRPAITVVKNNYGRKITLKWKKNSKATGYQIQYATASNFSRAKTATISKAKTTTKNITGLTKGKYYYVRMRSYKKYGKTKNYSAWSKVKKVYIMR